MRKPAGWLVGGQGVGTKFRWPLTDEASARCERGFESREERPVQIMRANDEIVGVLWSEALEIHLAEVDIDTSGCGECAGFEEPNSRDVDATDHESTLCQPNCILAFSAGNIERASSRIAVFKLACKLACA